MDIPPEVYRAESWCRTIPLVVPPYLDNIIFPPDIELPARCFPPSFPPDRDCSPRDLFQPDPAVSEVDRATLCARPLSLLKCPPLSWFPKHRTIIFNLLNNFQHISISSVLGGHNKTEDHMLICWKRMLAFVRQNNWYIMSISSAHAWVYWDTLVTGKEKPTTKAGTKATKFHSQKSQTQKIPTNTASSA